MGHSTHINMLPGLAAFSPFTFVTTSSGVAVFVKFSKSYSINLQPLSLSSGDFQPSVCTEFFFLLRFVLSGSKMQFPKRRLLIRYSWVTGQIIKWFRCASDADVGCTVDTCGDWGFFSKRFPLWRQLGTKTPSASLWSSCELFLQIKLVTTATVLCWGK